MWVHLWALQYTARTLRSGIEVLGCSCCTVSFMGLQTEFPIIICNLAMGTDTIIGTDVLGSVLPHTLDIKKWLVIRERWCFPPTSRERFSSVQPCFYSRSLLDTTIFGGCAALLFSNYWRSGTTVKWPAGGVDVIAEDTGLIVGRTLVDPSKWKVPVLVSNFSQETIVVNPFTEVGMITQVTAIQSVADAPLQPHGTTRTLARHPQDLVEQTCQDLDPSQRHRLADVLSEYSDIFPVPGAPLTGHTDAEEHDINTATHPLCTTTHDDTLDMLAGKQCFSPLTWLAGTGRSRFLRKPESRRRLRNIPGCFSFELCRLVFVMHLRHSNV